MTANVILSNVHLNKRSNNCAIIMVDKDYNPKIDEDKKITDRELPLSFSQDRHLDTIEGIECITQTWRMKERMKTVSVALVLCLNVGVDPPDIVKTQPCARLECWIDPSSLSPTKALEAIGSNLQKQYERWQPRARYKQSLDPTAEEVKKLCTSLRRNAKEERVLFHYNGHGVPKPTNNGEIWVFNRTYTQYIPLSVYDLQTWMGAPSIYVYDCSNAGLIVESFKTFAIQHENEYEQSRGSIPTPPSFRNCIQLAACSATQVLPMNPDLPADLFTACLTTPIKVALRWFVMQSTSKLVPKVTMDLIDKIPGQITDRRTMLGELNWIFTAITDTIAWNTLPRDLFQKLFRQDLLVASLFRNFLLAERILRSCDCTPVSSPALPPTYQHPMWQAWDLALDLSLGQLPGILDNNEPFVHLPFFEEQLTAFQVWLELGEKDNIRQVAAASVMMSGTDHPSSHYRPAIAKVKQRWSGSATDTVHLSSERRNPPEQLPIVLQVLLSQVHRMRALELLGKFLDLGPWAVNLALSVGIFPYVLKLLQSCAKELRPLLVFIWAKILAVDNTCQADLVRDTGHKYFLSVLQDTSISSEHRTQAAFVLACIVNDFRDGQKVAMQGSLVSICLEQLSDPSPQLRQWVAICLGRLWDRYEKARWTGVRDIAHEKLYTLLQDPCPEVRAAAVYALGTFINSVADRSEHANNIDQSVVMTLVSTVIADMNPMVRKELVAALQWVVLVFEHTFLNVALQESNSVQEGANITPPNNLGLRRIGSRDRLRVMSPSISHSSGIDHMDSAERLKRVASSSSISTIGHTTLSHGYTGSLSALPSLPYGSVYMKLWAGLYVLENDPHLDVAKMAGMVTAYIRNQLKKEGGDGRLCSSISLPPSPNRSSYLAESPPTIHSSTDLHRLAARGAMANRSRKYLPNTINEEDDREHSRKALVTTQFIPWACKQFAQPVMKEKKSDVESKKHYEREWRYIRNDTIRREAKEEQARAVNSRLESQVFNTRTQAPPSIVQFHPYDQQIAVAGKDSFGIWEWGTGAKLSYCLAKSSKNPNSRITALEWVNAHDIAMVMTGSDDGSVKLWKPHNNKEASLVTAWQAHNEFIISNRFSSNSSSGLLLTWEQYTQTVISSGDTRVLRFWDANKELRCLDIPTGADCSVTCLDSTYSSIAHEHDNYMPPMNFDDYGLVMNSRKKNGDCVGDTNSSTQTGLVAAGCADGSVRVFDRRCSPSEAKVKLWIEHSATTLGVQLRGNKVISGSANGDVRIYDIRKNDSIHVAQVVPSQNMTAIAIHRNADTYACGSAQQTISIHNLSGLCLNVIRFYEGFMGYRIGPVSCLAYHPHKVALATGTTDSSISVYCLEYRR